MIFYYDFLKNAKFGNWDLTWETFSRSNNSGIISHTTIWECTVGMEERYLKLQKVDGFNAKNYQLTSFLRLNPWVCWIQARIKHQKCGSTQLERSLRPSNLNPIAIGNSKIQEMKTPLAPNTAGYRFWLHWLHIPGEPPPKFCRVNHGKLWPALSVAAAQPTVLQRLNGRPCNAACGSGAVPPIYAYFDSENIGNNHGTCTINRRIWRFPFQTKLCFGDEDPIIKQSCYRTIPTQPPQTSRGHWHRWCCPPDEIMGMQPMNIGNIKHQQRKHNY